MSTINIVSNLSASHLSVDEQHRLLDQLLSQGDQWDVMYIEAVDCTRAWTSYPEPMVNATAPLSTPGLRPSSSAVPPRRPWLRRLWFKMEQSAS
ncbi:hypothetical protein [Prochlorothrix hollandica]|uniref:hypothetical protein n=1 Tax=Prochlorothrix hollandica TaxID=1223 RepID=UPI003342033F